MNATEQAIAQRLRRQGYSLQGIADFFGVTVWVVRHHLGVS